MAARKPATSFDAASTQPLIAIPLEENGREVVRYFVDEGAADRAMAKRRPAARTLAGAWARADPDLDWEELSDALDCLRHGSTPTPPIDLDL